MKKFCFLSFCLVVVVSLRAQVSDATNGLADAITQYGEREVEIMREQSERHEAVNQHIADGLGQLGTFIGIYQSARELYDAMNTLSGDECTPDLRVGSNHMMPSSCEEGGECYQCYESAVGELNFVRRQLARMSCIYHNAKNFADRAIAFGDDVSAIHGAAGLAWQYERKGIVESVEHLKGTYQGKYREFMQTLQHALMSINECESKFGQRDWYQKYGFIYFEFMQDKYALNE